MTVWSLTYSLGVYAVFASITGVNSIDTISESVFMANNLFLILLIALILGLGVGGIDRLVFRKNIIPGNCWILFQKKLVKREPYPFRLRTAPVLHPLFQIL